MAAAGVGWDAYTASALLSACQACGKWEQALRWFRDAQATPGARAAAAGAARMRSALLCWLAGCRCVSPAHDTSAAAAAAPLPAPPRPKQAGLQLNEVHYTTLMSCLQKAGQWEQSVAVFREMRAAGVAPDVVAYNAAIAACARVRPRRRCWCWCRRRSGCRSGCCSGCPAPAALCPRALLPLGPALTCPSPVASARAATGRPRGRCFSR